MDSSNYLSIFFWPSTILYTEPSLPISVRLLSEKLKELEMEGIIQRKVFPETPVRIEYSLTQKGLALKSIIRGIEVWSQEWIELEE